MLRRRSARSCCSARAAASGRTSPPRVRTSPPSRAPAAGRGCCPRCAASAKASASALPPANTSSTRRPHPPTARCPSCSTSTASAAAPAGSGGGRASGGWPPATALARSRPRGTPASISSAPPARAGACSPPTRATSTSCARYSTGSSGSAAWTGAACSPPACRTAASSRTRSVACWATGSRRWRRSPGREASPAACTRFVGCRADVVACEDWQGHWWPSGASERIWHFFRSHPRRGPAVARAPEPLALDPAERLVVVAPHPDDETLGAGGLIQRVLAQGGSVRVVLLTAGDGYVEGVERETGRPRPRSAEFVAYGERRLGEERAALRLLGDGRIRLEFLGFPDGGLEPLLTSHWQRLHPERSPT